MVPCCGHNNGETLIPVVVKAERFRTVSFSVFSGALELIDRNKK